MKKEWQDVFNPYQLTQKSLEFIEQQLVEVSTSKDQFLQLEGEECRGIYWVLTGEVVVFRVAMDGRELILQRLTRGGIFNLVPAFEEPPRTHAAVRATLPTQCLWLSLETIPQILQNCPDFNLALLRLFAKRLSRTTQIIEQIGLHTVQGRLAQFLLDQADGRLPARQYTQDEIAAQIGTVRDMIGRTLRNFEDAGFIRRDRNKILLLDRNSLESTANT